MSLGDFGTFLIDQVQGQLGKGKLLKLSTYRRVDRPIHSAKERSIQVTSWRVEPFRGELSQMISRRSWIAGANVPANNSKVLLVVNIPQRQNKLRAFDRALHLAKHSKSPLLNNR